MIERIETKKALNLSIFQRLHGLSGKIVYGYDSVLVDSDDNEHFVLLGTGMTTNDELQCLERSSNVPEDFSTPMYSISEHRIGSNQPSVTAYFDSNGRAILHKFFLDKQGNVKPSYSELEEIDYIRIENMLADIEKGKIQ